MVGVVRRGRHAFDRYHQARDLTSDYLESTEPHSPNISKYFAAVEEWEIFAHHVSIAIALVNALNKEVGGELVFKEGDGSKEQRLHLIANRIKHLDKSLKTPGEVADDDTSPLWLTNAGLASFGVAVEYQEVADVLSDLSRVAQQLQDPKVFSERTP